MVDRWTVEVNKSGKLLVRVLHPNDIRARRYIQLTAEGIPGHDGTLLVFEKAEAERLIQALQEAHNLL